MVHEEWTQTKWSTVSVSMPRPWPDIRGFLALTWTRTRIAPYDQPTQTQIRL